jgi:TPR repeat protein
MSSKLTAKISVAAKLTLSALAVLAAAVDLASQQHTTTTAQSIPVRPCGEFGKPPCGTVVNIPAGSTGLSLFAAGDASQKAGRNWEAIIYIAQSATLGYPQAESALGNDFFEGNSVPKDMTKARYWLKKAADDGASPADAAVGEMFEKGLGGPPDQALAIHYYELSAAAHSARGESDLAVDYEIGSGIAHNRAKAISLFKEAVADHGQHDQQRWVDALSRAGSRRFNTENELWAYVYPAPKQTQQQQSNVPAGCPALLNFPAAGYSAIGQFCLYHPGCPYQVIVQIRTCQRPLVEAVPGINY